MFFVNILFEEFFSPQLIITAKQLRTVSNLAKNIFGKNTLRVRFCKMLFIFAARWRHEKQFFSKRYFKSLQKTGWFTIEMAGLHHRLMATSTHLSVTQMSNE